jgi:hypothetical protein
VSTSREILMSVISHGRHRIGSEEKLKVISEMARN